MKLNCHCRLPIWLTALLLVVVARAADHTPDSLETVKKNLEEKKAVLVDVREKSEWDEGHIDGAIFLPLKELERITDPQELRQKLPSDRVIYTHCVRGKRAVSVGKILEKYGYEVRCLKPGYKELVNAGFKSIKD